MAETEPGDIVTPPHLGLSFINHTHRRVLDEFERVTIVEALTDLVIFQGYYVKWSKAPSFHSRLCC